MKRYYISDLVTVTDANGETSVEAAAMLHGLNCAVVFPPQNPDGTYTRNDCFVVVEGPNQATLLADSRIVALPEFHLDVRMNSMGAVTKDRMLTALQARGLPVTWTDSDRTFRDVVRSLGQAFVPNFNEDNFYVSA